MSRSMIKSAGVATFSLLIGGGFLASCGGGGAEATLIRGFFQASRYSDQTTLGNMSMVTFDPQEDGIASSPSVDNVSEEAPRPLRMGELADQFLICRTCEADRAVYQVIMKKLKNGEIDQDQARKIIGIGEDGKPLPADTNLSRLSSNESKQRQALQGKQNNNEPLTRKETAQLKDCLLYTSPSPRD